HYRVPNLLSQKRMVKNDLLKESIVQSWFMYYYGVGLCAIHRKILMPVYEDPRAK
ncbi:hypothetical protein FRX31_035518, partial [Thalictrum thalictroides]